MSDRVFVDTNVLVYAFDRPSGAKHDMARELVRGLWESATGVLSTQVLQEFAVYLRRKVVRPLSTNETRDVLQEYMGWTIIVNTAQSTLRALEIEERYKISFWDALVIQAAEAAGAEIIYTEDLSDGQSYGGVRAVNPFR
jgi:predicted nucleic acid-binding protein